MKKLNSLIKMAIDKWITIEDYQSTPGSPRYNVQDLINYSSKNLKPIKLNINDITGADRSKRTGFSKKRYQNTDMNKPIIVDQFKNIIDGRHRTLKAKDQNKKTIRGYILDNNIIKKKIKPIV